VRKRPPPAPPKTAPALLKRGSEELRKAKGGVKAATAKASAAIRETRKKKLAAALDERKERMAARRSVNERKATTKVESR
jgi:hypothetical protein